MRERERIIAVEIEDDFLIRRCFQVLQRVRRIVMIASHQDQGIRCYLPNPADTFAGDPVPCTDI